MDKEEKKSKNNNNNWLNKVINVFAYLISFNPATTDCVPMWCTANQSIDQLLILLIVTVIFIEHTCPQNSNLSKERQGRDFTPAQGWNELQVLQVLSHILFGDQKLNSLTDMKISLELLFFLDFLVDILSSSVTIKLP